MGRRKRTNIVHAPATTVIEPNEKPIWRLLTARNLTLASILFFTMISFTTALTNDFAYDDGTQILQNEFIRSLSNVPKAMVTEAWFWRQQQDKDPNKDKNDPNRQ